MYVCMYVCIEVALRGVPMEKGVQLGQGEGLDPGGGAHPNGSNIPTPRVPSVTHTDTYMRISVYVPNLIWAAKGELYPHVGGNIITPGPTTTACFTRSGHLGTTL